MPTISLPMQEALEGSMGGKSVLEQLGFIRPPSLQSHVCPPFPVHPERSMRPNSTGWNMGLGGTPGRMSDREGCSHAGIMS